MLRYLESSISLETPRLVVKIAGMATIPEALTIAIQHQQAGRLQAAEQIYLQILAAQPNHVDALHLLGLAEHQRGQHDRAVAHLEQAIKLNGTAAPFHNNLGGVYRALGRFLDAATCFQHALQIKPDYHEAHNNLGNVQKDQGLLDEAIASFRRAIKLKPDYAQAHSNLANTLKSLGKLDEAVASYRRAIQLKPDCTEAHYNLGNTLRGVGKSDEAVACYRRVIELKPDSAEAYNNLGIALKDLGRIAEIENCYRKAVELKPNDPEAHNNLGNTLLDQGEPEAANACYRRALALKPGYTEAHSNLLLTLHYCTGITPAALRKAHDEFNLQHAASLQPTSAQHLKAVDRSGRLRIGFVSPDLGRHPVACFLVRVLENLDQSQFETICYSDRAVKDDFTHRIQQAVTEWHDVYGVSDSRLADKIRADRISILFDLTGHTAHNRMLVFAQRPAPVQVTWIGYEGTTGLATMDYLIADRLVIPADCEHHYREHVLRMPDGYLCYDPPQAAPPVGPLPALKQGFVTFGSFNNLAKITPEVVKVWSEILRRVPNGRLILKYRGFGDPAVKRRYLNLFAAHQVASERLDLLPSSSYADYLATYHRVDLVLDPFPFSGGTTTCEALWMGVPVLTCPGETFASRHSLTHLSNIGLTETIAQTLDEYVNLAASLAANLAQLETLRSGLRERMAASPLCDGQRFATNLAGLLNEMWRKNNRP